MRRIVRELLAGAWLSGAFIGAYDAIPSITAAYGMRRLRSAYAGNLLRLRRSSDNAESDFGYAANGDLDAAAIATFVGAGSGYITTWYDQSGNGYNATQTTATEQPLYVASGQNGKPVARFDGTDDSLAVTSIQLPTYLSLIHASKFATTLIIEHSADASSNDGFYLYGDINMLVLNRTGTHVAPGVGSWMTTNWSVVMARYDGTHLVRRNASAVSNGTVTGTARSNSNVTTSLNIAARNQTAVFGNGDMAEFVIASAAWSAADYQAAESAANSYWSIY